MASCEKCWTDAQGSSYAYQRLIEERKRSPCTPEEQAGEDANECTKCKRNTIHIHTKTCTVCGVKELDNKKL